MSWQTQGGLRAEADRADERRAMLWRVGRHFSETAPLTGEAVLDERVRAALERVPRHCFVPPQEQLRAYDDTPLPIGHDQTISQPFIVALMTQLARVRADSTVLEIGTGSGYQAAVLSLLARRVYSIELVPELATQAALSLAELGYSNVELRCGDGFGGWPEHAPFDAILVTAAAAVTPTPLVEQLAPGGRLLIPVGEPHRIQQLELIEKTGNGHTTTTHELPVAFVPLERA